MKNDGYIILAIGGQTNDHTDQHTQSAFPPRAEEEATWNISSLDIDIDGDGQIDGTAPFRRIS